MLLNFVFFQLNCVVLYYLDIVVLCAIYIFLLITSQLSCYERATMEMSIIYIYYTAFLCYPWHNNICDVAICYTCIYFAE